MTLTPSNDNINDLDVEVWGEDFLDFSMDSETVKQKPAKFRQNGEINGECKKTAQGLR